MTPGAGASAAPARSLLLAAGFALALAGPAPGQVRDTVWEDPTLVEAVRDADLIVLGQATAVGEDGAAWRVVTTLQGPVRDGDEVMVTGLHHPGREDMREVPVAEGDRAYLILRGEPEGDTFSVPTPTFGRFPVRSAGEGATVVACLGDTYVRLPLQPVRFERFLAACLGRDAGGLAAGARASLDADPLPDPNEVYVSLRAVALAGGREDEARVLRALDAQRFQESARFRVRMAAAQALGRVATPAAVQRLLDLAAEDAVPAVRSRASLALRPALTQLTEWEGHGAATRRLAELALEASSTPIRFADAQDPRDNELHSPLSACLRTLSALGAPAGVRPALRALEREEDLEAVWAGLAYFEALDETEHVRGIVHRMRPADAEDAIFNRLFARTLKRLTGEDLGASRKAWLEWWREEALGEGGAVGPPVPEDDGSSPDPAPEGGAGEGGRPGEGGR